MTVEIFLRNPNKPAESSDKTAETDDLPNSLMELEMALKELQWTSEKLKESTDLLTEEFDKSEGEEAKEYYEYILDNLDILRQKKIKITKIEQKINQIKGVFKAPVIEKSESSGGAGGLLDGHYL